MCMGVLPVCLSVHILHAWCLQRPEEGSGYPGTDAPMVVSHHVGPGPNPGLLEERAVETSPAAYLYLCVKLKFKIGLLNIQLHVDMKGNINDYKLY